MTAPVTTESLLAAINETVLAVEQAQETLVARTGEFTTHMETRADDGHVGHVALKDSMGDESAESSATALTPKALKDFDTANTDIIINVRDMLRAEIEAVSGGRNTVVRDANGNPHVMVVVPKFRLQDIDSSLGSGVHPAFVVDGVEKTEILIGKYQASKGAGNVPVTLPRKAPYGNIYLNDAVTKCRALGSGFCCVTNAMWAARALWLWKYFGGADGEHLYYGNTAQGQTAGKRYLTGTLVHPTASFGEASSAISTTLTGSGPVDWNDDGTVAGICDLVGNAAEYVSGVRVVAGELQVIANNDAALASCDLGDDSSAWKAILENGSLVAPGTAGTLKYTQPPEEGLSLTDGASTYSGASRRIDFTALDDGSLQIPGILKTLGLFPIASNVQGQISFGGETSGGACYPARGGYYRYGGGPFHLVFYQGNTSEQLTFRVGYVV